MSIRITWGYFEDTLQTHVVQFSSDKIAEITSGIYNCTLWICYEWNESWNLPEQKREDPGDSEHDVGPVQCPLVVGERETDRLWDQLLFMDYLLASTHAHVYILTKYIRNVCVLYICNVSTYFVLCSCRKERSLPTVGAAALQIHPLPFLANPALPFNNLHGMTAWPRA